jgi:hypothetical protein
MAMIDDGNRRRAAPKPRPRDVPQTPSPLLDLLSDADREAVRARARTAAEAEKKTEAEKAYYEQALEEERRALEPQKEMRDIVIDLAPFAKSILIDGRQYHHGMLYRVPREVFDQIQEIVARGWAHDEEVGEPNRKYYQKPMYVGTGNYARQHPTSNNTRISPGTADATIAAQKARLGVR